MLKHPTEDWCEISSLKYLQRTLKLITSELTAVHDGRTTPLRGFRCQEKTERMLVSKIFYLEKDLIMVGTWYIQGKSRKCIMMKHVDHSNILEDLFFKKKVIVISPSTRACTTQLNEESFERSLEVKWKNKLSIHIVSWPYLSSRGSRLYHAVS